MEQNIEVSIGPLGNALEVRDSPSSPSKGFSGSSALTCSFALSAEVSFEFSTRSGGYFKLLVSSIGSLRASIPTTL
jgi:hypothetical protein